jgi:maleamate amidohydrolase
MMWATQSPEKGTTMANDDLKLPFGAADLQMPDDLRQGLHEHLDELREKYLSRGWGYRVGFGKKPALLVIDLAYYWTRPDQQIGAEADSIVNSTCDVLAAAREAEIPIFFTSFDYDPADPPSPQNRKLVMDIKPGDEPLFELDERLGRRPTEKLIRKRYASAFKATNLHEMLTSLGVDTLIVTGMSTSHCVYASCRDATDSFRVIVPREAVGERCEIMHLVNLLDIDIDLGDVMDVDAVVEQLGSIV